MMIGDPGRSSRDSASTNRPPPENPSTRVSRSESIFGLAVSTCTYLSRYARRTSCFATLWGSISGGGLPGTHMKFLRVIVNVLRACNRQRIRLREPRCEFAKVCGESSACRVVRRLPERYGGKRIIGSVVKNSPGHSLTNAAPLLEEKRHSRLLALVTNAHDPLPFYWPSAGSTFTTNDYPINATKIQHSQIFQEWLD